MKIFNKKILLSLISIAMLVASLTVTLLDALIPLNIWVHPVLTFAFCIFVDFGVLAFVLGFTRKNPWFFFLGSVLIGLSLVYALSNYTDKWWLILIVVAVVWAIFAILGFMNRSNTPVADNESADYKNYQERKAEKVNEGEEKELPKIKSFKD